MYVRFEAERKDILYTYHILPVISFFSLCATLLGAGIQLLFFITCIPAVFMYVRVHVVCVRVSDIIV